MNCFIRLKGEIIIKNIFKYILGYCNCCGKYFKYPKLYRENTMYNDEEMNWHRECKSCFNKHENYWDECWKEYYSGRY